MNNDEKYLEEKSKINKKEISIINSIDCDIEFINNLSTNKNNKIWVATSSTKLDIS
jgi:hypothetical protein